MMRVAAWVAFCALAGCLVSTAHADDETRQRVRDALGDGDFDGAAEALGTMGDDPDWDLLWGLVHLGRAAPNSAVARLERAAATNPDRDATWLYLGQAYFANGDADGAHEALKRGEELGRTLAGYYALRSRVEIARGLISEALATLDFGIAVFPDSADLYRDRALTYLERGLSMNAVVAALAYRDRFPDSATAWLVLGSAHHETRRIDDTTLVLEQARLRFPDDADVTRMLASVYAGRGWNLAAARTFAVLGDGAAYDTAEQFRVAGRHREALRWNARVADRARRINQRIALLVEGNRYDAAMALYVAVNGEVALDETVAYHVGYAALRTDRFDTARDMAMRVDATHPDLARSLREAADRCATEPWTCR